MGGFNFVSMRKELKENSKRLKRLTAPLNPTTGDPEDTGRKLFSVVGFKKSYLPYDLMNLTLFKKMVKAGTLSKFIKTLSYISKYRKVSELHKHIHELRLKHDFLYWLGFNYEKKNDLKKYATLIRVLQWAKSEGKPIRLILKKPEELDIAPIIMLYISWLRSYSPDGRNAVFFAPTNREAILMRQTFYENSDPKTLTEKRCKRGNTANSINSPYFKSVTWFLGANNPEECRGLNFYYLVLADMGNWKNSNLTPPYRVFQAAYPVIPTAEDSVIILYSGQTKRCSIFKKEWSAAQRGESPFKPIELHWYDNPENIIRMYCDRDKIELLEEIKRSHNRKSFPHYPNVRGKEINSLWERGMPLESISWYLAESTWRHSPSAKVKRL